MAKVNACAGEASFIYGVIAGKFNYAASVRHILIKENQITAKLFCDSKMKFIAERGIRPVDA